MVQRGTAAGETGAAAGETSPAAGETGAVDTLHWLRTLVVIGLLVLMVWKPGA
jgi:hypothetical protein